MLYLVPTPIGNLSDITLRALDILRSVDYILCEDTRTSGRLLKHHDIQNNLKSYHAHNEHQRLNQVLDDLRAGLTLALISDAGTPGISDPGFLLVRACAEADLPVQALPGSTALIPALVQSGIPCNRFHFEGFLPIKKGRQTRLKYLTSLPDTFVLYESPHRIIKSLRQLMEHCGPHRRVALSRELTKLHEETIRGTLQEVIEQLDQRTSLKGEIVVVVAGSDV